MILETSKAWLGSAGKRQPPSKALQASTAPSGIKQHVFSGALPRRVHTPVVPGMEQRGGCLTSSSCLRKVTGAGLKTSAEHPASLSLATLR